MARRNPRPRRRALGLGAVAVAAALAGALAPQAGRAQPAPDLTRARDLYQSAQAAMNDGRYDDAARDYSAAYDLSSDPALLYKIGRARERAGACEIALGYYARYLREGRPSEQFAALTRERIAACGGDPGAGSGEPTPATGSDSGSGSSSGGPAAGSAGPAAGSAAAGRTAPGAGSAAGTPAAGDAAGSAAAPPPVLIPPTREKVAWLLGGSAIAL
ncbi:MAG TPA: hypothetical protein VK601_17215, partial [Kofleriaceae bacterium]|nr:hypothetical protein [Kofleriaceae bacterium]